MEENKIKQLIVPFGKYKGKPLEVLLKDESYSKWLSGQDWFQEKFKNIYTIIVNNYHSAPIDTPEHNQMQVKFLNEEHALKLAFLISRGKLFIPGNDHFKEKITEFIKELKEYKIDLSEIIEDFKRMKGQNLLKISQIEFEKKGVDVSYDVIYGYGEDFGVSEYTFSRAAQVFNDFWSYSYIHLKLRVELKPSVGDDFPSVLRQMKSNGSSTLVIRNYTGTGASYEEFKNYFTSQGITVVTENEIEEVIIPPYDSTFHFEESIFE